MRVVNSNRKIPPILDDEDSNACAWCKKTMNSDEVWRVQTIDPHTEKKIYSITCCEGHAIKQREAMCNNPRMLKELEQPVKIKMSDFYRNSDKI